MMRITMLALTFVMALLSEADANRIRVRGSACIYVLEREITGKVFQSGTVAIIAPPDRHAAVADLGALPVNSGVFKMWKGQQLNRHKTLQVTIPRAGGPWRGMVVQLCPGQHYLATPFTPIPGQPPSRRSSAMTEALHCTTANVLTCIPWAQAVAMGLVMCEKRNGSQIETSVCQKLVPYTMWDVK